MGILYLILTWLFLVFILKMPKEIAFVILGISVVLVLAFATIVFVCGGGVR